VWGGRQIGGRKKNLEKRCGGHPGHGEKRGLQGEITNRPKSEKGGGEKGRLQHCCFLGGGGNQFEIQCGKTGLSEGRKTQEHATKGGENELQKQMKAKGQEKTRVIEERQVTEDHVGGGTRKRKFLKLSQVNGEEERGKSPVQQRRTVLMKIKRVTQGEEGALCTPRC